MQPISVHIGNTWQREGWKTAPVPSTWSVSVSCHIIFIHTPTSLIFTKSLVPISC